MLTKTGILSVLLVMVVLFADAHEKDTLGEEKGPISQFLEKRGYEFPDSTKNKFAPDTSEKWPDTLYYNTPYHARLLGSPTIPISFSRIEYRDGAYQVTPTLSIGYGYAWFTGEFIFNENDKITVDPRFFFGLVFDLGVQSDFNLLQRPAGVFAGGFVGFGNFSLFFGYDFIPQAPSIGLGGRVDLYTIKQKFLKPIGKVQEVRRHKKVAPMISDE